MGNNQYIYFFLVVAAQFLFTSCDQKTGDLLSSDLNKPASPRFETISEAPFATTPTTTAEDSRKGAQTSSGKAEGPSIASLSGSGVASDFLPTGPIPGGPPPVPTDDDLGPFEDDFVVTPGIPYGVCGNGRVDFKEQCDDGNQDNTDGCNVLCHFPVCGNGVLEKNEECDDGNNTDGDGCNHRCDFERCGNKCLDFMEQCDDGNLDPGDGCSPCCLFEVCANKVIDPKEECDDGNLIDGDGCSRFCEIEICGNGKTTPNEQCDDGNLIDGDCCSSKCIIEKPPT